MRDVEIIPDFIKTAAGSALVRFGGTRVLCTAMVDELTPSHVPPGSGWLSAEYAMLPASTRTRKSRGAGKPDGRSMEIQRMIGRALRAVVDLGALGPRTIRIDCDVLEADGGTRTAAITGSWVALKRCEQKLLAEGRVASPFVRQAVAAVSAGYVEGKLHLDLDYALDSHADVDFNCVFAEDGSLVELQGAAEKNTFTIRELNEMLDLSQNGIRKVFQIQREAARPLLVLATNNAHKARELAQIAGEWFHVRTMRDVGLEMEIEETGDTFEENARIKAHAVMQATGCAALADDSGICVEALGGAPGVYSARYAGEHAEDEKNNELLLKNMQAETNNRKARFISVVVLSRPGREDIVARGECEGELLYAPRGSGGFGYDPLFNYRALEKTFAELTQEEKNAISHRARALKALRERLEAEA